MNRQSFPSDIAEQSGIGGPETSRERLAKRSMIRRGRDREKGVGSASLFRKAAIERERLFPHVTTGVSPWSHQGAPLSAAGCFLYGTDSAILRRVQPGQRTSPLDTRSKPMTNDQG